MRFSLVSSPIIKLPVVVPLWALAVREIALQLNLRYDVCLLSVVGTDVPGRRRLLPVHITGCAGECLVKLSMFLDSVLLL